MIPGLDQYYMQIMHSAQHLITGKQGSNLDRDLSVRRMNNFDAATHNSP